MKERLLELIRQADRAFTAKTIEDLQNGIDEPTEQGIASRQEFITNFLLERGVTVSQDHAYFTPQTAKGVSEQ